MATNGYLPGAGLHKLDTVHPPARGTPGPEVATLVQGRFKRDGGAAGDPEQHGGADTGPARREDTADAGTAGAESGAMPESGVRSGPKHGSRIAMRNWRISTRLVSLLALPVVAATTLGALRIQSSLENVKQLDAMTSLTDLTEQATKFAAALQNERDISATRCPAPRGRKKTTTSRRPGTTPIGPAGPSSRPRTASTPISRV